jgi:hypothetical protein
LRTCIHTPDKWFEKLMLHIKLVADLMVLFVLADAQWRQII